MPSAYLQKLHESENIPMAKLEEYWEKAKAIAKKNKNIGKENFYAYTTGILKNMLSISGDAPSWWKKLDDDEQQEYLEAHPNSKFKRTSQEDEEENFDDQPRWWKKLDHDEQKEYLENNEDAEDQGLRLTHGSEKVTLKQVMSNKWGKRRAKAVSTLARHKRGLRSLKALMTGGAVSNDEREQAMETAKLGCKLVIGSLMGLALVTGFGMFIGPLAQMYTGGEYSGSSESSEQSDDPEAFAAEFMDGFHEWFTKQDLPELLKQLKKEN